MDNRTIKTNDVIAFLFNAEINWVIINKNGKPLTWEDGNVKVYSCIEDLMADYDKKSGQSIMTEYAYVMGVLGETDPQKAKSFNNFKEYADSLA